ncbi:MAG: response regulator transcription factor [Armatimonadetes bacterium]|nr:response regulator transcription factor [Armatimonadota bacterium]
MGADELKVLVIDDEPQIRRALRVGLERHGHRVFEAEEGEAGLDAFAEHSPDLVILDLAMPRRDGLSVCRELRSWSSVPIIVLSVRDYERDKIEALDLGADDYLTKPFSLAELMARMRAVSRRTEAGQSEPPAVMEVGELVIDFARREVTQAGVVLHLTPIEFDLLRTLAVHADRVLTHRFLLTAVWGEEWAEDVHTLRVHISNLRNKIEPEAARPRHLCTEPRVGYRFRSANEAV